MGGFPVAGFNFEVKLGDTNFIVSDVTGLNQDFQVLEYRYGGQPEMATMKRPGLLKTSEVVLKKGIIKADLGIKQQLQMLIEKGTYTSKQTVIPNLVIQLNDEKGAKVMIWTAQCAVPVKIAGADLKADQNQIAFESITFAHMGIIIST